MPSRNESVEPQMGPVCKPEPAKENLPYRVVTNFFKFPKGMIAGEASAGAVNAKGHIFLFQRTKPMFAEYDEKGSFVQS